MLINEPSAVLRLIQLRLYDENGDGLSLLTGFSVGQSKISKNGGAFVNTVNLPQAVASGSAGTFTLQLALSEVDTEGTLRLQISPTNGQVYDAVDEVRASSVDSAAVALAVGDIVIDANAPEGARTLKEQVNIIAAFAAGEGVGFPQSVIQSITYKSLGGDKTRLASTISGGRRVLDDVDGT